MSGESSNTAELSAEDLQRRLDERQGLVEELTARLEQAAEQLDRLKRSGADRTGRGGMPSELIAQQRSLTEELQNAVQQWEDMQPTELLARVEMQVIELRDLIVDRFNNAALTFAAAADAGAHEPAAGRRRSEVGDRRSEVGKSNTSGTIPTSDLRPPTSGSPSHATGSLSSYEAFKAGLLDTEDAESSDEGESDAAGNTAGEPAGKSSLFECPPPLEIPAVDSPGAVDLSTATVDELRGAVDERDSYIAYLIRRLRAAESMARPAGSWSDLEGVPDELRGRLEDYERRLEESLRFAEVETSLERARLSREATRLEHLSEQLRKKAVQLGASDDEADEQEPAQGFDGDDDSAKKNGRWFRLFGK